jgi:hypothetical protein
MFSLGSALRSRDRMARTVVFLSLCPTLPLPVQSIETLAAIDSRSADGPGWYDSSWDLSCGLDIAEVPAVDVWIDACEGCGAFSAPA